MPASALWSALTVTVSLPAPPRMLVPPRMALMVIWSLPAPSDTRVVTAWPAICCASSVNWSLPAPSNRSKFSKFCNSTPLNALPLTLPWPRPRPRRLM